MITQFTKLMLTLSVGVVFCAVPCGAQGEATPLKQLFTLEQFGYSLQLLPDVERGEDRWFTRVSPKGRSWVWRFRDSTDTVYHRIQCLNEDGSWRSTQTLSGAEGQVVYGDFNGDGLRDWLSGDWTLFEGRPSGVLQCVDSVRRGASLVMDLDKDGYDDAISRGGIAWGHPTHPLQARSSISVERFDTVFFGGDYTVNSPEIIFPTRVRDTAIVMYSVWFQHFYDKFYDQRWQYVQSLNEDDIRSHAPIIRTAGPRNAVRRMNIRPPFEYGVFYPSLSYYRNDRYVIVSGDTIYELTPTSLIPQRSEQQRIDPRANRVIYDTEGWSPIDTLHTVDGYYFFTFDHGHLGRLQVDLYEITEASDPFPQRTGSCFVDPQQHDGSTTLSYPTRASFFMDQTGDGKYEIAVAYQLESCYEFDPECWTTRIFDVFGSKQPTSVGESGHTETTDITLSRCVLRWTNASTETVTVRTVDNLGKLLGVLPATADVLRSGLQLPPSMCPRGLVHVQIVWNGGMKTATFMNDAG